MSATNGGAPAEAEIDIDPAVFQQFADLEKEFASAELDALRRKEFQMRPLYARRTALSSEIPLFWPSVLINGPQEFQSILNTTGSDALILAAVKSLSIERYQITSETTGEPRSLRFVFEFDENDFFEDTRVVKEFEFVEGPGTGGGGFVSQPVGFKWKKKGKKSLSGSGLLDLAVDLYKAEETMRLKDGKTGKDLEVVDREGLWQYEKLRGKLEELQDDEDVEQTWLDWFGYRGAVAGRKQDQKKETNGKNGESAGNDEEEEEEIEDDGTLDVEIFPAGDEIAIALADDLWPNVMDYFMASQQEPFPDFDEDEDEDDEEIEVEIDENEIPDLVEVQDDRPSKRQKRA